MKPLLKRDKGESLGRMAVFAVIAPLPIIRVADANKAGAIILPRIETILFLRYAARKATRKNSKQKISDE